MRRLLRNVVTAAPLLVSICAAFLWGRSYSVRDELRATAGRDHFVIESDGGGCVVANYVMPIDLAPTLQCHRDPTFVVNGQNPLVDFYLSRDMTGWPKVRLFLKFPHWAAVAAGLVLPATVLILRRRRRSTGPRGFPLRANGGISENA